MNRTDNDGDRLTNRAQKTGKGKQDPSETPKACQEARSILETSTRLGYLVTQFTNFDHGFLKMRRSLDSTALHLTWTWSVGPPAGKYVYVTGEYWQLLYLLTVLSQKILEVDEGSRKPTPDKLGHWRP